MHSLQGLGELLHCQDRSTLLLRRRLQLLRLLLYRPRLRRKLLLRHLPSSPVRRLQRLLLLLLQVARRHWRLLPLLGKGRRAGGAVGRCAHPCWAARGPRGRCLHLHPPSLLWPGHGCPAVRRCLGRGATQRLQRAMQRLGQRGRLCGPASSLELRPHGGGAVGHRACLQVKADEAADS